MKRILELDFIKAFAVILMTYTHVAIFFYDFSLPIFNALSDLGGYISLTLFLFVSGATLPILIKKYPRNELVIKLLKRSATFFVLYVLVALFITGGQQLGEILTLQEMPILSDFIFAFSLFFLLGVVLVYLLPKVKPIYLLLLFLLLYVIGYVLYYQGGAPELVPIKSILVGHTDMHRFPLFQYSIVYVLGVIFSQNKKWFTNTRLTTLLIIFAPLALIMIYLTGLERWVASPGFMLYGLLAVLILLLLFQIINAVFPKWQEFYNSLSKRVSGILIGHIVIIVGLSKFVVERYGVPELLILTFVVIFLSWWLGRWVKI